VLLVLIFALSSFLDNIAAAMIGGAIAHTVFRGKVHIGFLAAIVAASNAGGAGSVVGDTTTTMMWIAGVGPLEVLEAYIAALVAMVNVPVIAAPVSEVVDTASAPFYFHAEQRSRAHYEVAHRMLLAGGDDEILGLLLLQHQPLGDHEILRTLLPDTFHEIRQRKPADDRCHLFTRGSNGVALLDDTLAAVECSVVSRIPQGDHTILIGHVEAGAARDLQPLLYYRGGYASLTR